MVPPGGTLSLALICDVKERICLYNELNQCVTKKIFKFWFDQNGINSFFSFSKGKVSKKNFCGYVHNESFIHSFTPIGSLVGVLNIFTDNGAMVRSVGTISSVDSRRSIHSVKLKTIGLYKTIKPK